MIPIQGGNTIWLSIPTKQIQKGQECHLLALQRLKRPISCKRQPTTFKMGTTIVNGIEKDDRIEVTVEIQIELQAPPEHIVKGIERYEKIFKNTYFTTDLCAGLSGSTKLKNAYANKAKIKNWKDLRCLTIHLLSSKPPVIPPQFLIALERVIQKRIKNRATIIYLALFSPDQFLQR